jgi:DNA-binding transcriptional LysR family regulator
VIARRGHHDIATPRKRRRPARVWRIPAVNATRHIDAMKRSELADLAAFVAVAEGLSFRAGAARLGITRSALSHCMQQLEKRLDVRLLHRSTRGVALTDTGRRLFDTLRPAFAGIEQGLADLDHQRASPSGRLRLHVGVGAAAAVIAPVWRTFLAAHPRVELELELSDGPVDVVGEGFDAAIAIRDFAAADTIRGRRSWSARRPISPAAGSPPRRTISPCTTASSIASTARSSPGRSCARARAAGSRCTGR